MKAENHETHTSKKDHVSLSSNRKAKLFNSQSKKLHNQHQKSIKRNLNCVFAPIIEVDAELNSSEPVEKIPPVSETVDADLLTLDIDDKYLDSDDTVAVKFPGESFAFDEDRSSIETYIASLNQHISPSSVTAGSVESTPLSYTGTTPLSSITTVEMTPFSSLSPITANLVTSDQFITKDMNSIKLEPSLKHLRESMVQVLNPTDIEPQYKKLFGALEKVVIQEFCSLHEEKGLLVQQSSMEVKILLLSCLLGMLVFFAGFFIFSDAQNSYHGPAPT